MLCGFCLAEVMSTSVASPACCVAYTVSSGCRGPTVSGRVFLRVLSFLFFFGRRQLQFGLLAAVAQDSLFFSSALSVDASTDRSPAMHVSLASLFGRLWVLGVEFWLLHVSSLVLWFPLAFVFRAGSCSLALLSFLGSRRFSDPCLFGAVRAFFGSIFRGLGSIPSSVEGVQFFEGSEHTDTHMIQQCLNHDHHNTPQHHNTTTIQQNSLTTRQPYNNTTQHNTTQETQETQQAQHHNSHNRHNSHSHNHNHNHNCQADASARHAAQEECNLFEGCVDDTVQGVWPSSSLISNSWS